MTTLHSPSALDAAPAPRTAPAARPVLLLICLALLALAGLCGYELWARLAGGRELLGPVFAAGLDPLGWAPLPWVGAGLVVIGVLVVISALLPTRRSHVCRSDALWLGPTAIARLCSARARTVAGVSAATTGFGRRRVTVTVSVTGRSPEEVNAEVRQAVRPVLDALDEPRQLAVRVDVAGTP